MYDWHIPTPDDASGWPASAARPARPFVTLALMRIVWYSAGLLTLLLGCRFFLKLLGADPASRFASVVYQVTFPPLIPFLAIVPTPQVGPMTVELFTVIAI